MLLDCSLPKNMWGEAINHANRLKNLSPTQVLVKTTPYEKLYGRKPDLTKFRTFGSTVDVCITKPKKKLENRGQRGIFVGFAHNNIDYRVYVLQNPSSMAFVLIRPLLRYHPLG